MTRVEEIEGLRKEVDSVDEELVQLLRKRLNLALQLGELKKTAGLSVKDVERERQVLAHVRKRASGLGLNPDDVEAVYEEVMAMCERWQKGRVKVAYLGPVGTFSEEAARSYFESAGADFTPCPSVHDVSRLVDVSDADFGVVPVENSLEGSYTVALGLLLETRLMVCGEVERRIHHNLIAKPGTRLQDIRLVVSHSQALAQCREYLERTLPKAERREVASTARAVEMLKELENAAAIGAMTSAKIYGMEVLAKGIEDQPNNFTRFFILGHTDCQTTGRDKTSIIFAVRDVPGALFKALEAFSTRDINLTKVESRPTRGQPWQYVFYLDFEGHKDDVKCREALTDLASKCIFLKVLGSYPRAVTKT